MGVEVRKKKANGDAAASNCQIIKSREITDFCKDPGTS